MKLIDCVDVVCNNDDCVVLKVKPDKQMDLICLGCFDGNETMMRMTKTDEHTYTIWRNDGTTKSWHNGLGGHTCVSDKINMCRKHIAHCIIDDCKIDMGLYVWHMGEKLW